MFDLRIGWVKNMTSSGDRVNSDPAPAHVAGLVDPGPFGQLIWPWPVWPAQEALAHVAGIFGPGPFGWPVWP